MKEIVFVTSNKGKVATAQKHFKDTDILLTTYNHDLIEPRTDDLQEIAKSKVLQAYEIVKRPCIALDSGFFIDELNGFPRAFVNHALGTIGIKGIIKLMDGIDNRSCSFKECLAYYDGKDMEYFFCTHNGKLANSERGIDKDRKWSDLWYIFIQMIQEILKPLQNILKKRYLIEIRTLLLKNLLHGIRVRIKLFNNNYV